LLRDYLCKQGGGEDGAWRGAVENSCNVAMYEARTYISDRLVSLDSSSGIAPVNVFRPKNLFEVSQSNRPHMNETL
jgi:hypothetical protein